MPTSLALLALTLLSPPDAAPTETVEIVAIEPPPAPTPSEPPPAPSDTAAPTTVPTLPLDATAPIDAPAPKPEPKHTWQAELFADLLYAVNSNSPDNHVMRGFLTSPRSGEFTPNVVGAFVRHAANEDEPWWFELGIHAGPAVDALVAAEPSPGGAQSRYAGLEVFKHIALANAGFRIRKSGTTIGAGVIESPFGLSSFWTFRNPNYAPMWQNNIVPYYFSGARITQDIPGGLTFAAWVVNGAQTYADANKAPSGIASLTWTPKPRKGMKGLVLKSHVLFGPEGPSIAPEDWYVLWDSTLVWDFDAHFTMGFCWDYAIENPGRIRGDQNVYMGGGILARGTIFENEVATMDLVLRPDVLWDRDGRFFGVEQQWFVTPTATLNTYVWERLIVRAEYRFDWSSNERGFFYRKDATADGGPGLARTQHTVFVGLTALWDFWFGRRRA